MAPRTLAPIAAVPGVLDAQAAWLVTGAVELSLYVPAAVNCSLVPNAIDGLLAVIAIDVSTIPVPASATVWVVPAVLLLLSVITIWALLRAPCDNGVNVTSSVQDAPAARVASNPPHPNVRVD